MSGGLWSFELVGTKLDRFYHQECLDFLYWYGSGPKKIGIELKKIKYQFTKYRNSDHKLT